MRVRLQRRQTPPRMIAAWIIAVAVLLTGAFTVLPASATLAKGAKTKRGLTAEEFSAQSRQVIARAPRRVRIYSHTPGPNSVRICNAHYEQEYRPSGTVIVPRMQCYWSG